MTTKEHSKPPTVVAVAKGLHEFIYAVPTARGRPDLGYTARIGDHIALPVSSQTSSGAYKAAFQHLRHLRH